ncbi:hypothetical protein [Streptomyces laurentii]|uniref:hypothetical protein n=1 Tax=Streptomyces laurentii TaxID=39478 RepID=UPI0033C8B2C5
MGTEASGGSLQGGGLVGRPLWEDAGPSPRFGDDVWKMAAAYHLPNHHKGQSAITFTTIEDSGPSGMILRNP